MRRKRKKKEERKEEREEEIKADACNEETLVRFASTHKLSEAIREREQMDRKKVRTHGRREETAALKCWETL